jgi:3-methyladenine DNA glycosylase AlkD
MPSPPPLAGEILRRLPEIYLPAADPVRAEGAAAYMRDQFVYLGITSPRQRELDKQVLAGLATPTEADLAAVALGCWRRPEREYQYFACSYLRRYVKVGSPALLETVRSLIITRSWWDTVDTLAANVVGPLVSNHPALRATMDAWSTDDNLWLVRTAILHQLRYRSATDPDRLFRYCDAQAGHGDFFIRKAIGWALREYARTDPDAVRTFVATHRDRLSGLSVREASKHL